MYASVTEAAAEWAGTTAEAIDAMMRTHRTAGGCHWHLASKPKPDASELMPTKNRPVMCVETGEMYESVAKAARAIGIKDNNPISCTAKKGYIVGGHHWKYVMLAAVYSSCQHI